MNTTAPASRLSSPAGLRVRVTAKVPRALTDAFVGWGAYDVTRPAAEQGLVDVEVGAVATVTGVSQHGAAPFTRWHLDVDGAGRVYNADPAALEVLP